MSKGKAILKVAVGCLAGVILWFVGWLLYAILDLWQVIAPSEFQNILFIGIGLSALIGVVFAHRSLTSITNGFEHRARNPETPAQPEITELREDLDKLTAKVEDIHAFIPILKKREETKTK